MNNKKSLIKSQITFNQIHAKVSMLLSKYIKENDHVLKQIDPKKNCYRAQFKRYS